jgi:hypothetical protein
MNDGEEGDGATGEEEGEGSVRKKRKDKQGPDPLPPSSPLRRSTRHRPNGAAEASLMPQRPASPPAPPASPTPQRPALPSVLLVAPTLQRPASPPPDGHPAPSGTIVSYLGGGTTSGAAETRCVTFATGEGLERTRISRYRPVIPEGVPAWLQNAIAFLTTIPLGPHFESLRLTGNPLTVLTISEPSLNIAFRLCLHFVLRLQHEGFYPKRACTHLFMCPSSCSLVVMCLAWLQANKP